MKAKTKYKLRFISLSFVQGTEYMRPKYQSHRRYKPGGDMSRCKINTAAMKINPVVTG